MTRATPLLGAGAALVFLSLSLPPVSCVVLDEDGDLCGNAIDDDDDGLVDCDDPTCVLSVACDRCGDGELDITVEACDDGNRVDGDGCDADCFKEGCGNGVLDEGEACDDGNRNAGDGCDFRCEVDRCGDGTVQAEEQCDDGNRRAGDGCDPICDYERPPHCGDFILQFEEGEQCEDGNVRDNDGCNGACKSEFCGDGRTQSNLGEQCDLGPNGAAEGCCFCQPQRCGDFSLCGDEQCDDGNTFGGDGCDAQCRFE